MKEIYKDTDLREALRRKYSDTPQLPADFMTKMQGQMTSEPVAKTRKLWRWVAAAACLLFIVGIGFMLMPKGQGGESQPLVAQKTVQPQTEMPQVEAELQESPQEETVSQQTPDIKPAPNEHKVRTRRTKTKREKQPQVIPETQEQAPSETQEPMPDMMSDPFLMAEMHAQQIRTRGMRLQREIEQLMNN
jgi:outer membrane biosynthesis protein TonB